MTTETIEQGTMRGVDWQAREVQFAIEHGKLVVPVLAGRGRFPSERLPAWAAMLASRSGVTLADLDPASIDAAVDAIARIVLPAMPGATVSAASA